MKPRLLIGLCILSQWVRAQAPDTKDQEAVFAEVIKLDHCAGQYAKSVFSCATKERRFISLDSVTPFLTLVNNKRSYKQGVAACHDPGMGIILYNKDRKPVSWYSLCMSCNNVYAEPAIQPWKEYEKSGFSYETRKKLRALFAQWGFNYVGASQLFDKPADFEKLRKLVEEGKGYN